MNEANEAKLCQEFPRLYRQYGSDPKQSCMAFGFEVDDGWFDLIYELSKKLEAAYQKLPPEERAKWDEVRGGVAEQVKEKWGGLRFYISGGNDEMYQAITEAEEKSFTTCEACGKPGKSGRSVGNWWIKTLCDECRSKNTK
jgi:hypothetical protein